MTGLLGRGPVTEMSPIPKANEPGNNPGASGEGKGGSELDPQPAEGFDAVVIAGNVSSEEEDSDGGEESSEYGGYQLLEQDPEPEHPSAESEEEVEEGALGDLNQELTEEWPQQDQHTMDSHQSSGGDSAQPHLPTHLAKLLPAATPTTDPDSASRTAHTDTPVSFEQRKGKMATDDQIRAAMAGFSLPTAAVPSWARSVSEEDWKKQLVARIQSKHDKRHAASTTQQKGDGENG